MFCFVCLFCVTKQLKKRQKNVNTRTESQSKLALYQHLVV